jgi:alpha-glucosidase
MSGVEGFAWWQTGIVYQVYPRSFMDSDGDGTGDLPGITSKLDYLQWLGVEGVWVSPFFKSPMADFGYDVSDYCDVAPIFGTMADFERLREEAHKRDLKLILDFVPNHTSEEHPWFVESSSSRDNPKREWYIWRDAKPDGSPPNNWVAHFGGIAWEWHEPTGQYYLHSFLKQQPDLDWRNPEVVDAMMDVLRFWLDRGVDGFRVDVMWETIKDAELRDNPPNPRYEEGVTHPYFKVLPHYNHDQPEVHQVIGRMRGVLEEYPGDRVLIGEIYLPVNRLVTYYGTNGNGAHMPFNFQLILQKWQKQGIADMIDRYEAALPPHGWPNWVLGNHDRPRVASRIGRPQARVAAMLLLTLRGTPTIYQGEELGMEDVLIPPERAVDPPKDYGIGRDPERTPMQWTSGNKAGFTTGEPWLPLAPDYEQYNVESEQADERSYLNLHRKLIELRQSEPALQVGGYQPIEAAGDILAYEREHKGERFVIALNLGAGPETLTVEGLLGTVAISTHLDREAEAANGVVELRGDEGVLVKVS